eukprot:m.116205 g.116205  ORF g.116205 m.116205 type:complete len:539 (+) comp13601_c0_seq2:150-1766(+)
MATKSKAKKGKQASANAFVFGSNAPVKDDALAAIFAAPTVTAVPVNVVAKDEQEQVDGDESVTVAAQASEGKPKKKAAQAASQSGSKTQQKKQAKAKGKGNQGPKTQGVVTAQDDDEDDAEEYIEMASSDGEADSDGDGDTTEKDTAQVTATANNANKKKPRKQLTPAEMKEKDRRTIFVGNLPAVVDKKDLQKHFKEFGRIESIRFRTMTLLQHKLSKRDGVIRRGEIGTQQSSIHAYIVFEAQEAAKAAVQLNGTVFLERHIRVDRVSSNPVKFDPSQTVFVGNLPLDVTEESLYQAFEEAGTVDAVRIVRDKETAIGKGFAYVKFQLVESVSLALALRDKKVGNRPLRIKRCKAMPRKPKAPEPTTVKGAKRRVQEKERAAKARKGKAVVTLDHRGKKPRHKPRSGGNGQASVEDFEGMHAQTKQKTSKQQQKKENFRSKRKEKAAIPLLGAAAKKSGQVAKKGGKRSTSAGSGAKDSKRGKGKQTTDASPSAPLSRYTKRSKQESRELLSKELSKKQSKAKDKGTKSRSQAKSD